MYVHVCPLQLHKCGHTSEAAGFIFTQQTTASSYFIWKHIFLFISVLIAMDSLQITLWYCKMLQEKCSKGKFWFYILQRCLLVQTVKHFEAKKKNNKGCFTEKKTYFKLQPLFFSWFLFVFQASRVNMRSQIRDHTFTKVSWSCRRLY